MEVASKQLQVEAILASKQLEIRSQIKVPEAQTETEESFNDSDEMPQSPIPSAPPIFRHPSPRQRRGSVGLGDGSQTPGTKTSESIHDVSPKRRGKRRRTEDTLKPEPENDRRLLVDETRTQKETWTDNFVYFVYFLAFCAFISFLMFLFLLSVLFILLCLYVFRK